MPRRYRKRHRSRYARRGYRRRTKFRRRYRARRRYSGRSRTRSKRMKYRSANSYLQSNASLLAKHSLTFNGTGIKNFKRVMQRSWFLVPITQPASKTRIGGESFKFNCPIDPLNGTAFGAATTLQYRPQGFDELAQIYTKYIVLNTSIKWRIGRQKGSNWASDTQYCFWSYPARQDDIVYTVKDAHENGFPIRKIQPLSESSSRSVNSQYTRWQKTNLSVRKWLDNAASSSTMEVQCAALTDYSVAGCQPSSLTHFIISGAELSLGSYQKISESTKFTIEFQIDYDILFWQPYIFAT